MYGYVKMCDWEKSDLFNSVPVLQQCAALNVIGPRAMDVLSELSYVPLTPDHFPSLFCKVRVSIFKLSSLFF